MGNVLGFGDEEGVLGISEAVTTTTCSVAPEPYFDYEDKDETDLKKRRRRYKKHNGDNNDAGVGQATGICKKNDGKGWHCNRPANPHHTLCDHHLTQLKSYSSTRYNNNSSNTNSIAVAGRGGEVVESEPNAARVAKSHNKPGHAPPLVKHRRRKTKAGATAAAAATSDKSDGDGYYYYSGFGLSRGKSRSNGRKEDAKVKELVEEEVSAGKEGHNVSRSGNGSDAPIAGGDLDDDTDDDSDEKNPLGNVDNNKGRIQRKKRGRKPIKARSLKSLFE